MSEQRQAIERAYEEAKRGDWEQVLSTWRQAPHLAQECSRYQKPSSGWTFLHQAAYFGHEVACRELIRLGAVIGTLSHERQSAADVAEELSIPPWQRFYGELLTAQNHFGVLPMTRTCFRAVTYGERLWNVEPQKQCVLPMVAALSRFQRGHATSWTRLSARWSGSTALTTRLVEWMASQWLDRAGRVFAYLMPNKLLKRTPAIARAA